MTLGDNIRDARVLAGLTQRAAARAAGISHVHWNNLEQGHSVPSVTMLLAMAKAMGTTGSALLTGVE